MSLRPLTRHRVAISTRGARLLVKYAVRLPLNGAKFQMDIGWPVIWLIDTVFSLKGGGDTILNSNQVLYIKFKLKQDN
jgi:hypothetical protein